ncbi:MAG: TlpA family protein disulfide reductase [Flavobacteriales bacterium]|nr:TlpA family protein disulfide reductase [Flavobacteriales bacterium]
MFKYLIPVLLILLGINFNSSAQNVTIKGKAESYKGQFISIVQKKDYISGLEEISSKSLIDENGNFEVAFDTEHTIKCALRIGSVNANIYISPDRTYIVSFPETPKTTPKTLSNSAFVSLLIDNGTDDDLNSLISDFNIFRDDFIDDNYGLFMRGAYRILKTKVDSFKINANEKFGGKGNAYFKVYLKYSIGEIEIARGKSKQDLYDEYVKPHAISFYNNQYMNFFSQYYGKRMGSIALYNSNFVDAINIDESLEKINEVLAGELGYNTPKLREAAILFGLFENRNSPVLLKNGILKILNQIADHGLSETHKEIARNIIIGIKKNMVGSPAHAFDLLDENGNMVSLSDFKGKYVYIDFWATWCVPCLREMKMMKSLEEKYGDRIEFISISIDKDYDVMKKFLGENKYDWTFLHMGNSESLKNKYAVMSIPIYYLIDPYGKFIRSPAKRPSANIQVLFDNLLEGGD